MDYLEQLNEIQRQAVTNTEGASLIIAGAGSGKTRVLTYRIAHLLNNGAKPYSILSLTFTNKAAREMKERIASVVGKQNSQSLWMGTFHSLFARILRLEAEHTGYPRNFTIYDTYDSRSLLKSIIKSLKLDEKQYRPNEVQSRISMAKNNLITAQAYANNPKYLAHDKSANKPELYKVYSLYSQRCKTAGAMDFDDLLLQTNILFRDNLDVLAKYQRKFKYILVDEYQDTNFSQYLIVKKLAEQHNNVCVVGDDAQSIYSFRGAKIENIFNFKNDYPKHQLYKLEQNYRSTQNIVDAANSLIANNKKQIQKNVFSENEEGSKIKLLPTMSDNDESYKVADKIATLKSQGFNFSDFAILYRTNAQSRVFESAFRKYRIPYKIYGGLSFYQRKEIKDVLAYCRICINSKDNEALKRIINYPKRGIGDASLTKIEACANDRNLSFWEIIKELFNYDTHLSSGSAAKVSRFVQIIEHFKEKAQKADAFETVSYIVSISGILKDLEEDKTPEGYSRKENVQELLNGIKDYTEQKKKENEEAKLENFLEEVALLSDQDEENEDDKDKVVLMTVHSAKGLEFKNVFIVGMEDGLFPSSMVIDDLSGIEEERRLFYVAITRAEKNLFISSAKVRYRWGKLTHAEISRFIRDINPKYLDMSEASVNKNYDDSYNEETSNFAARYNFRRKEVPIQNEEKVAPNFRKIDNSKSNTNAVSNYIKIGLCEGALVEHQKFGKGKILKIEGDVHSKKATIKFEKEGEKTLLLKFAKLKVLN